MLQFVLPLTAMLVYGRVLDATRHVSLHDCDHDLRACQLLATGPDLCLANRESYRQRSSPGFESGRLGHGVCSTFQFGHLGFFGLRQAWNRE